MFISSINNAGDTIVEVLISVAVMSLVLGTAFVGANRAYGDIRDAQQHQIAVTIAQTQFELLNNLSDPSSVIPSTTTSQNSGSLTCFNESGSIIDNVVNNPPGNSQYLECSDYNNYNEDFTVNLTMASVASSPATFEVNITWPNSVGNSTEDDVQMFYQTNGS